MKNINKSKATLIYQSNGITNKVTSNETNLSLSEATNFNIIINNLNNSYIRDDSITYILIITNTGKLPINQLTISNDLAAGKLYKTSSKVLVFKGVELINHNIVENNDFKIIIRENLEISESFYIIYTLKTNCSEDFRNIISINANNSFTKKEELNFTPSLLPNLRIIKSINPDLIDSDNEIIIKYKIINTGDDIARDIKLTDYLPNGFSIKNISVNNRILKSTEYVVNINNQLIIPESSHIDIERDDIIEISITGQIKSKAIT